MKPLEPGAELDRWNRRFSSEEYEFGTEPNAFLASQKPLLARGMRALCVADGEGRNSVWLAAQGLEVTAFDFSPVGIAKAKKLAERSGAKVAYHLADVDSWDWDAAPYDVVVAIFVQFTPPAQRARMFQGMIRALKPGGVLILQGYGPEQLRYGTGGPKQVENLYTEALLRESFASLEILHLASHEGVVDEGAGHKGMSALIDLVARKPTRNGPAADLR
jgi:SAM-dependent methyltransferase